MPAGFLIGVNLSNFGNIFIRRLQRCSRARLSGSNYRRRFARRIDRRRIRRQRFVLNNNRRPHALNSVDDELHHNRPPIHLLHLACAMAKSHRARRPLTAFACRALPDAAEVVFKSLGRTFHGLSTNDQRVLLPEYRPNDQEPMPSNTKYNNEKVGNSPLRKNGGSNHAE